VVRSWRGIAPLASTRGSANVVWDGRDARGRALAAGYYQFQLRAAPTVIRPVDAGRQPADIVVDSLAAFPDEGMQQKIEVMIGAMPIPRMPVFSALGVGTRSGIRSAAAQSLSAGAPTMTQAVAAGGGLPYTIYYGNLHSQTNHSDGGAPVALRWRNAPGPRRHRPASMVRPTPTR
jgi:hypothetical protein